MNFKKYCPRCSQRIALNHSRSPIAFTGEENFKLLQGKDSLKEYLFNKKVIHHYFCTNCGIGPFGAGQKPNGEKSRAINVRCLDNVDVDKYEIIKYNGRDLV